MSAGFDNRIVSYETIHKIKDEDFDALIRAIAVHPGEIILDGCCGYGEVSKRILNHSDFELEIYLLDESLVQINRAKKNLPQIPGSNFIVADIARTPFTENFFDKVVIKMGIHEVPKEKQKEIFKEVYRVLKPGGSFVTWELALDESNQELFQKIIREKDQLAGFDALVKNRYFPRLGEVHALYENCGFKDIEDFHEITYSPSTFERIEEMVSRERINGLDQESLRLLGLERTQKLTEYVRKIFPDELKVKLNFMDKGEDITFEIKKMIIRAIK